MLRVIYKEQLIESNKRIVCYGYGSRIKELEKLFPENELRNKINLVVDNSPEKFGSQVALQGETFDIVNDEIMYRDIDESYLILITCYNYADILDAIEDKLNSSVETVCLSHIMALESERNAVSKTIPNIFSCAYKKRIPRTIHYCWFGGESIPQVYLNYMDSWKRYCPGWDVIRWDETNYDVNKNKYMKEAYDNKLWAFVSDYARLDIIYEHGGVYLDIDVELIAGIEDMLSLGAFMGFETWNKVNTGLGFGAFKGHPLIRELRDEYNDRTIYNCDGTLNMTCCPEYQTEYLKKRGLKCDGEYQVIDGLHIFPEKMLCAKSMASMCINKKDYSRAIHHFEGSWSEASLKRINYRIHDDLKNIFESV